MEPDRYTEFWLQLTIIRITFEWIRIDPDSMWVCHKSFEQEDFMWNSLIRQDKDIIAHYEVLKAQVLY